MLKKSTKITSLVVAAATMASMVPAMAADKIADKDGNIYRAIAFKDGKFYVDGDDIENAGDEDGVFWLNGGKHEEVDSDVDSGDAITGVYGEKYVEIEDGDYYFDLSTGKVTDDQLVNDDREDAASELAKKVRKDDPDRYLEETRDDKAQVSYNKNINSNSIDANNLRERWGEIWEVPSAPYNKPYYEAKYLKFASDKGDHVVINEDLDKAAYATVYTDADGKYIDADNDLGTVNIIINKDINASTTTTDALILNPNSKVTKAETIEFNEVGDQKNKDKSAQIDTYIEDIYTLGQDKDNVYRLAALHVKFTNLEAKDAGKPQSEYEHVVKEGEYVTFGSTKNPVLVKASDHGRFYVIQKISKETDGDKDGANLPKTTTTYLACENKDWKKKGKFETTTTTDAAFLDVTNSDNKTNAQLGWFFDGVNDDNEYVYAKPDGAVVTNPADDDRTVWYGDFADNSDFAYTIADGKVSKYQYGFETLNDNGSADNDNEDEKFIVKTFELKKSNGMYYIDADKNDDDFDDEDEFATTIDKDGNIWKLDSGKIYKYKNDGGYELMYKCDGGLNELSVYDENNLIAYNEDDDVYAIIGGESSTGKYEVEGDTAATDNTTTQAQAGWVQDATTGAWSYVKADGTKAIGWFQSPTSGLWYYMDANGVMQANGWIQDGGSWYYLKADGAMATGWVYTGGAWYFLKNTAGNMGAMQTGWIQTGGKWYYCNASGAMLSNTTVDGYVLGADGAWIK